MPSSASDSAKVDFPLPLPPASMTPRPLISSEAAWKAGFDSGDPSSCDVYMDPANLGDDTLYSGTVAAAVEGRFLGLPAIAVSLCVEPGSPRNFSAAAEVAAQLVQRMAQDRLQGPEVGPVILNVNVPDLPDGQLRGIKVTRLGSRHRSKSIVKAKDPRGRNVYWVGNAGAGQDAGPGTDFHAVAEGFASITPLQIDLTRHAALPELQKWLKLE